MTVPNKYFYDPNCEIRAFKDNDDRILEGRAIPYETRSKKLFGFMFEIIKRGAFDDAVVNTDIYLLHNHDVSQVLGRTKANTLTLTRKDDGIYFRSQLGNTSLANDVYEMVHRGDVSGMSFGFKVIDDNWYTKDGEDYRDILKAELIEISVVTMPAYSAGEVHARSAEEAYAEFKKMHQNRVAHDLAIKEKQLEIMLRE